MLTLYKKLFSCPATQNPAIAQLGGTNLNPNGMCCNTLFKSAFNCNRLVNQLQVNSTTCDKGSVTLLVQLHRTYKYW
jgi:hypothetical protein